MTALDKPRPLVAIGLVAAAVFVLYRAFHDQRGATPLVIAAHGLNLVAITALAARWAKPEWKKTAMVIALLSALLAFVVGRSA